MSIDFKHYELPWILFKDLRNGDLNLKQIYQT